MGEGAEAVRREPRTDEEKEVRNIKDAASYRREVSRRCKGCHVRWRFYSYPNNPRPEWNYCAECAAKRWQIKDAMRRAKEKPE